MVIFIHVAAISLILGILLLAVVLNSAFPPKEEKHTTAEKQTERCPKCGFAYGYDPKEGFCNHCKKSSMPQQPSRHIRIEFGKMPPASELLSMMLKRTVELRAFGVPVQDKLIVNLTTGIDNPKGLPIIAFRCEGTTTDSWNITNLDQLFANMEWQPRPPQIFTPPHQKWFEKKIRAWLPGQFPISKKVDWNVRKPLEMFFGEVEVVLTCYKIDEGDNSTPTGNINQVPESTVVNLNIGCGWFGK